jgi:molecular chaperone GrpE
MIDMTADTNTPNSNPKPQDTPEASSAPVASDEPLGEPIAELSELEMAQQKITELQDQILRAAADVQNTRRRAIEDETKARKFAIEGFADALLPVKDSLEAALNTPNQTPEGFRSGVEATLKQLVSAFERNKVIELAPAAGDKLDPHKHQAISAIPAEQEANTVVTVLQKGYAIAERTLRPALVTVAAPK